MLGLSPWAHGQMMTMDPSCVEKYRQLKTAETNIIKWARMSGSALSTWVENKPIVEGHSTNERKAVEAAFGEFYSTKSLPELGELPKALISRLINTFFGNGHADGHM